MNQLPMRGTLLNTATVAVGALLGLAIGSKLPQGYLSIALAGLGLVTVCIGIKLFFESRNVLIVAISVAVGGVVGTALGLHVGLERFAEWARAIVGGGTTFNEGLITTSVLFCVGPMTLLGCLQDGLEGKIELLSIKSLMDGIAAVFFAATLGAGVLVTALVVLVVQGTLTLLASKLKSLSMNTRALAETSAAGGCILLSIGIGLLNLAEIPSENFLPALVFAPCLSALFVRFARPSGSLEERLQSEDPF